MEDLLMNIDIMEVLTTIWTVVLLPTLTYISTQAYEWLKSKKLDKYADILYLEVVKSVKCVYETCVKDIKGTDEWTIEKQVEVKEIAKQKALNAISNSAYKMLKTANEDFDIWLDNMIGTALYDVKHEIV